MFETTKQIDGRTFKFTVSQIATMTKHDRKSGRRFSQKVIEVTDGVGFGPSSSWQDAIEFAKEMAADQSDWRMKQLRKNRISG
jgi:hypothetical protein